MICLYCLKKYEKQVTWATLFVQDTFDLCEECLSNFEIIGKETCTKCGREYNQEWFTKGKRLCMDCESWYKNPQYKNVKLKNFSLYKYNEFAKEFVAKWKFRGDYELIYSFKNRLKKLNIKNIDYIVPIPLSEKRGYERGFNQSEAICNLINSKKIKLIIQKKEIEKQSKKTKQERVVRENPFFIPNTDIIKEKNILLVDDIYTTGTTLHQVSKLLYENGAREIKSFTIFR